MGSEEEDRDRQKQEDIDSPVLSPDSVEGTNVTGLLSKDRKPRPGHRRDRYRTYSKEGLERKIPGTDQGRKRSNKTSS